MANRTETILSAADSDMLVGDYLLWSDFHEMQMTIDINQRVFRRGKDFWGHEQNLAGHGGFNCSANLYNTRKLKAFIRKWRETATDTKADFLPFLWAAKEMLVGSDVGFTLLNPKNETFNLNSGDVASGDLTGSWNSVLGEGELVCGSAGANTNLLTTDDDSDFAALWTIGGRQADYYSPSVAVSNTTGAAVGALVRVKEHVGNDAEVPTLTFPLASAANWRLGVVRGADIGKTFRIGHTVDGQIVYKTFGPWSLNVTTATVQEQVEAARWADGFHIFITANQDQHGNDTEWIFRGSHDGADSDIVFPSDNEIPTGAPFRGSDSGTDGNMQIRVVKATGTGGSRVFTPLSDFYPADKHDLPLEIAIVDTTGLTQIALQARLPVKQPSETAYDFQVRYLIGVIVNGS